MLRLVKDGAFTLKTVQNPRVQQRISFIDAEGEEVGNGDIFDMMEIVADTRKMTVDFNTQQSSGIQRIEGHRHNGQRQAGEFTRRHV